METKMITGVARLSYANLFEPTAIEAGGTVKYNTSILIPKTDKVTLGKYKAIIDALKEEFKAANKGKLPANFKSPLRDGDAEKPDDEAYAGHFFFNASSLHMPRMAKPIGKDKATGKMKFEEITDSTAIYSGCYCKLSVNFYLFDKAGNKGIAAGLNSVVKVMDGEPLGGASARLEDEFADEEFDMDFNADEEDGGSYLD